MALSWNYLKQFHFNPPNMLFPREEKIQEKYNKHKEDIGISIDKYVIDTILKKDKYRITTNLFPYKLDNNIGHYLLWISPDYKLLKNEVEDIIKKKFKNKKFICYKNKLEVRSIKTVEHYQIFIYL